MGKTEETKAQEFEAAELEWVQLNKKLSKYVFDDQIIIYRPIVRRVPRTLICMNGGSTLQTTKLRVGLIR